LICRHQTKFLQFGEEIIIYSAGLLLKKVLRFLLASLFIISLGVLLFELTLTRIYSIILWYNYAFVAISVAFFGLGIGALVIHSIKNNLKRDELPKKILQSTLAFAVSLPFFLFVIGHLIPPSISFINLFFLVSSIPFFFAGLSIALIYLAMPRQITRLYFIDLAGASAATLIFDPFMQVLGAEAVLLVISVFATLPSIIITATFVYSRKQKKISDLLPSLKRSAVYGFIVLSVSAFLLVANIQFSILTIQPGENKGLHRILINPTTHDSILSTKWNSFSRIDVVNKTLDRQIASILIDADALTPILKWNGSSNDLQWIKGYMDYMPYEMSKMNSSSTLVIGSGGGEDILVALAAGSKVTAVELNPLIVSAVDQYGGDSAGNLYKRKDVQLYIDDGRRFISSTNTKYDFIVIKLVDSWAAQLAGGYALSENYLYTVEAFKQYLSHLNGDTGKLVMVRWSTELPRLIPLAVEALREYQKETNNQQNITKQILVVEDRPGLTFGPSEDHYPVLLVIKNTPFTTSELNFVKEKISNNNAKVVAMPGDYFNSPYNKLLLNVGSQQLASSGLKPPRDDSPFYFAKELIPNQMVLLIETVLGVSVLLAILLAYYSRVNRIKLTTSSRFHVIFAIFIGLGFIFLEITFIQKFLLLLGSPIMALIVILFSVLLSTGVGSYLSGRLFHRNPYRSILISIPILIGIVLTYFVFLQGIINSSIGWQLQERIALTIALLSPAGLLMGFQFPSITRMASSMNSEREYVSDITLLWGVNVTASVIGTVLTATSSMVIGFSGNLLIASGLYLGALGSSIIAAKLSQRKAAKEKAAD
jgi:hypothetical protein